MRLLDLPDDIKPREKAIRLGIENINDAELLAIILRTGYKDNSAIDLGYELIKRFGNLNEIKSANYYDLVKVKGMGTAKSLVLLSCIEFSKRTNYQIVKKTKIEGVKQIYELYEPILSKEPQEKLIGIFLDAKHYLIKSVEIFKGTLTSHQFHPRDLFREAIRLNSASLVILHNHPSGDLSPSQNDYITTEKIFIAYFW